MNWRFSVCPKRLWLWVRLQWVYWHAPNWVHLTGHDSDFRVSLTHHNNDNFFRNLSLHWSLCCRVSQVILYTALVFHLVTVEGPLWRLPLIFGSQLLGNFTISLVVQQQDLSFQPRSAIQWVTKIILYWLIFSSTFHLWNFKFWQLWTLKQKRKLKILCSILINN